MVASSLLLHVAATVWFGVAIRPAPAAAAAGFAAGASDSTAGCVPADLEVRRAALGALVLNAPQRIQPLLEQLRKPSDGCGAALRLDLLTRDYGASADGRPNDAAFRLPVARELAAADPDTAVRRAAILALATDSEPAGCEALAAAVRSAPTPALRDLAFQTIIGVRHPHAAPQLRALYPALKDSSARQSVINVIAATDSLAWPWLLGVAGASGESPGVRGLALAVGLARAQRNSGPPGGAPGRNSDVPTTEALGIVYGKLPDAPLRQQVLGVVAQRTEENAAAELLARIARKDPDVSLRQQAVAGLKESKSPRAAALLAEIAAQ